VLPGEPGAGPDLDFEAWRDRHREACRDEPPLPWGKVGILGARDIESGTAFRRPDRKREALAMRQAHCLDPYHNTGSTDCTDEKQIDPGGVNDSSWL
jgi:hypothetical protein